MAVVSISMPDALLEEADAFAKARGYAGRSELFRAALRGFLERESEVDLSGERSATMTVAYPDGAERRVSDVRHRYSDVVQAMMHGHSDSGACVEVFMLHGAGERVAAFADALRGMREVRLAKRVFTDPGA